MIPQPDWKEISLIFNSDELDNFDKERLEKGLLLWRALLLRDMTIHIAQFSNLVIRGLEQVGPLLTQKIAEQMARREN